MSDLNLEKKENKKQYFFYEKCHSM